MRYPEVVYSRKSPKSLTSGASRLTEMSYMSMYEYMIAYH